MKKRVDSLIKKAMWISILIFILRCIVSWNDLIKGVSAYDVFGYIGEAIGVAAILIMLYERWGWQWDPFPERGKSVWRTRRSCRDASRSDGTP